VRAFPAQPGRPPAVPDIRLNAGDTARGQRADPRAQLGVGAIGPCPRGPVSSGAARRAPRPPLLEFHSHTIQAAPRHLARPGLAVDLKLEIRRDGCSVRQRDRGAGGRDVADGAVDDRGAVMQNDLAGLQGPVPLSVPVFVFDHDGSRRSLRLADPVVVFQHDHAAIRRSLLAANVPGAHVRIADRLELQRRYI